MKAIIVDDEYLMIRKFVRLSEGIEDLLIVGSFENASGAIRFALENSFEAAFIDIAMPGTNGIELAKELRKINKDVIIVFISAYDDYLWDFNKIGGDYYILKPYDKETLEMAMERLRLLLKRQEKEYYIQTFGRFLVMKNGRPLPLTGKAKEILAFLVTKRGREAGNEEIYSTLWENRPYSNVNMTVYYNALRRLKSILKNEDAENLLISTRRGQMLNTAVADCDYYSWMDDHMKTGLDFKGEFLTEYSWGETILADMMIEK
jgi:two-component SAPR family response regulator